MLKAVLVGNEKNGLAGGILYLTDNLEFLRKLQQKGEKVAAILTEDNYNKDFSGIPYAIERVEEMEQDDFERLYRRLAGLPWEIIETERCRLREMTAADVDRLYEIYQDASITRYMENLFEDREKERNYAQDYRKYVYEFYGYGIWIIIEKKSGVIIGRAGIEPKGENVELGYMIASPWQRKGYAFEVCSAVLAYAWREVECSCVISRVQRENTASVGLLKKLGFHLHEGSAETGMDTYKMVPPVKNPRQ